MKGTALVVVALAGIAAAACTFYPSAPDDRADLITGSHIPKNYPPGSANSDVQVVKPTPADNAVGSVTAQPVGSRPQ